MSFVFVSHAASDKRTLVRPLVQALAIEGVSLWIDRPGSGHDDFQLPPEFVSRYDIKSLALGQGWDEGIRSALRDADTVLICLSRAALGAKREVLRQEMFGAQLLGKAVTCIIDDIDPSTIPQESGLLLLGKSQALRIDSRLLDQAITWLSADASRTPDQLPGMLLIAWQGVRRLRNELHRAALARRDELRRLRMLLSGMPLSSLRVRWVLSNPPEEIETILRLGDVMSHTYILRKGGMARQTPEVVSRIADGLALENKLRPVFHAIAEGGADPQLLYACGSVETVLEEFGTEEWVDNYGSDITYNGPDRELIFPLNMRGTAGLALGKAADDADAEPIALWQIDVPDAYLVTRHRFEVSIELLDNRLEITFDYDEAALAAAAKMGPSVSLRAALPDRFSVSLSEGSLDSRKYLTHLSRARADPKATVSEDADPFWSDRSSLEVQINGLDDSRYVYAVTRAGRFEYAPHLSIYDTPEIEYRYVRFDAELIGLR